MFKPLRNGTRTVDALIYRRYKPPAKADLSDAWSVPDGRKVNPWDLNEPNPGENGTMGTIPGSVIEGEVGDDFVIHFRNNDNRLTSGSKPMAVANRCHSSHPHGVVFKPASDGAFPLSQPDSTQPVGGEAGLWASVPGLPTLQEERPRVAWRHLHLSVGHVRGPTTAGIWLYHDHSVCDDENVNLDAIGIIVIHNAADATDVDIRLAADPTPVSIKLGDTVHWIWQEDNHSVTADVGDFDSGMLNNDTMFDHMFMTAGTFRYCCKTYGGSGGAEMSGQVVVIP